MVSLKVRAIVLIRYASEHNLLVHNNKLLSKWCRNVAHYKISFPFLGYIAAYVFYVIVVVVSGEIHKKQKQDQQSKDSTVKSEYLNYGQSKDTTVKIEYLGYGQSKDSTVKGVLCTEK